MQNQDLFLLQLLKIPVIIIKFVANIFAILTYLPNYMYMFLIDTLLFHPYLQSTLFMYILTWIVRVVLLYSALGLFIAEFYLIFLVMQLHQHGIIIQSAGIILTLAGLIILMRKGYLTLLKKYNLTKLKSPMEHIQVGLFFFIDCFGIILWIVNTLMIVNMSRSWDYKYDKQNKYQFIRHIAKLIQDSILTYLEFFYVKIFFALCPWRFSREKSVYQKQKIERNMLNVVVLLTLIFLLTFLDIIVVGLFGLPCLAHFQRRKYLKDMGQGYEKYKITIKQFLFICLHSLQGGILVICTVLCWSNGVKALKKWINYQNKNQLFGKQFSCLIIQTALKIPYIIASFIIIISFYKLKRRDYLLKNKPQPKPQLQSQPQPQPQPQPQGTNDQDQDYNKKLWITFKCVAQLLWDMCFFPFIIFSTCLKPWNYWWLKYLIQSDHTMNLTLISQYLLKNIKQLFALPILFIVSTIISTYDYKRLTQTYKKVTNKQKQQFQKNQSSAHANPYPQLYYINKSIIIDSLILIPTLKDDLPHIPYLFIAKMTLLQIYKPDLIPSNLPNLIVTIQRAYSYLTVKKSIRFNQYHQMFNRIRASGGLVNIKQEYRFWKYAHRCQRLILIQKIMCFLLPKRSVENLKKKVQPQTTFSQISNLYWNHYQLTKAMIIRFIFLIIEFIITLIGIFFLFPLTLWRIPTFISLISFHKSRKFFFPILSKIYKQMLIDIIILPSKLITILIAPKMYISFIIQTSFKYGPLGIQTFKIYQQSKYNYFLNNIFKANLTSILINLQIMFIYIFWIRIKQLKSILRTQRLTIVTLQTDLLLIGPKVLKIQEIITSSTYPYYNKLLNIYTLIKIIFKQSMADLPYLLLMVFIFITMPWRINYIVQVIKDMRQDSNSRRSFFKLLRNIFKDYACIFMNVLLLLSIFKTKKAIFLIRRNYRLNFFIGFLQYSYYKQLKNQIISLGIIYKNIFFLIIAILFGWTRTSIILNELSLLRKKMRQQQQSSLSNKKIYQNTVKSGKQLQTLHKMGYYNYITVCSFLTLPQILKLRQVDKFNYTMTQRQQIWFMKWQSIYSKQSNQIQQNFENQCKNAYIVSTHNKITITYQTIIMNHFNNNVFQLSVDLPIFLKDKLSKKYYDKIFKNYQFTIQQGYGPQNELPRQENQDEQFLRMTNQIRRPLIDLDQPHAWMHLLYARKIQFLSQKLHRYFREDVDRRKKQIFLVIGGFLFIGIYLSFIWIFRSNIFCIDNLITLKILFTFYFLSFIHCMGARCQILSRDWISLRPFDIYYDFVNFAKYIATSIKNYVIKPTKKFLKKVARKIKEIFFKIVEKIKIIWAKIASIIKAIFQSLKSKAVIAKNFTIKYSILAYQKVVKPLYLSIADKLRKLKQGIIILFTAIFKSIKQFFIFLGTLIKSFYSAIRSIFSNINKLYYYILQQSMVYLLKFGLIGNLIFTLFGLLIMTMPSIIWWVFYPHRWYLIVSTIHTMVLIVVGYKHLNTIRNQPK